MADERLTEMDRDMEQARSISREAILRVGLLSASIVAFSATLLSIEQIDVAVDRTVLGISWCLFAAVVVFGPLSVALEARAKYVVAWRALQPQDFDGDRRPTLGERVKLYGILAYCIAIRPRSLFFARLSDYSANEPTQGMWMNFRMILLLHKVWDLALALELLIWTLFASAVVVLLVALM